MVAVFFFSFLTGADAVTSRGTNISVDSGDLEPFSGDTAMDINENGDPNLNFRF